MIAQALEHDGPALVEVVVSRQELSMPPTVSFEQAKGFSLFMLKAVLSGRGDELIARVCARDFGVAHAPPVTDHHAESPGRLPDPSPPR